MVYTEMGGIYRLRTKVVEFPKIALKFGLGRIEFAAETKPIRPNEWSIRSNLDAKKVLMLN